mmetsp:Transcript_23976/g.33615  ORF Transcript_23976/g.33615 Transcript_23976/m.33615 type:complete len:218 (-) Transcript_23976:46-699(-)
MTTKQQDYDRLYKLLMVGDSGVGKSSWLLRVIEDKFQDSYISTIGVDFMVKTYTIGNVPKRIKIQIWDTAGRERFRTITSSYWRGAHGAVFTYDITCRESFDSLLRYHKEMERYRTQEDIKILLIGTKSDLEDKRQVTEDEGQKLADLWNAQFAEVSSKTGANVEESFLKYLSDTHEQLDLIVEEQQRQKASAQKPPPTTTTSTSWWDPIKKVFGLA